MSLRLQIWGIIVPTLSGWGLKWPDSYIISRFVFDMPRKLVTPRSTTANPRKKWLTLSFYLLFKSLYATSGFPSVTHNWQDGMYLDTFIRSGTLIRNGITSDRDMVEQRSSAPFVTQYWRRIIIFTGPIMWIVRSRMTTGSQPDQYTFVS